MTTLAPSRPKARAIALPMPCCAPVTSATFPPRRIGIRSEGGADELAAESHEAPRRALRVPAEADVGGERVLVPEEPLDGIAVVDAVGARQGVEGIDRVRAELHGVGDVAPAPQLVLDRHEPTVLGHSLGLEAVGAADEPRR